MNGEILLECIGSNSGVILGEDNKRYSFYSVDKKLRKGMKVNFEIDEEGNAKDPLPIVSQNSDIARFSISDAENPRSSAIIAAVGACFGALSVIPFLGFFFLLIGYVTELIGVKRLSTIANRPDIFWNMIWSLVLSAVAVIIGVSIMGIGIFTGQMMGNSFETMGFFAVIGVLSIVVAGIWSIVKQFKALSGLASAYNIPIFKFAAWCYAIALPTLFIGIGLVLIVVYQILLIVGYLSIKEFPAQQ